MMMIVAGIMSSLSFVDAMQLSKISPAEQQAIKEGPILLDELVPSILENLEYASDLNRCMQVSSMWYVSAGKQLLRVFGRLGPQNQILPDFTKLLKSSCNQWLLSLPLRMQLNTLITLIKDKPRTFSQNDPFRTWASKIISAVPYILETYKCFAFTGMIDEMIDIGGLGDVIELMIPFQDDILWDPVELGWRALLAGETRDIILKLAQKADTENWRALELASFHSIGAIGIDDFFAQVSALPSVPLQLLVYLCRIGAEDFIGDLMQSRIKFSGKTDDCGLLKNIYDCGPIGLEIARYSKQYPELWQLSSILLAHEHVDMYFLEEKYLPVWAYMAFGDGPFGKAFKASAKTYGAFSVAADSLYSYLMGSYSVAPESVDRLIEVIFLIPTENLAGQEIKKNLKTFAALIEHPILSYANKKEILQKYFRTFPTDLDSTFRYLQGAPNSEIGYHHVVDMILGFTGQNITVLHSVWKHLYDKPEIVQYIDDAIRSLMKSPSICLDVSCRCQAYIDSNLLKPLSVLEFTFTRCCIAWTNLSQGHLVKLIGNESKDSGSYRTYMFYLGLVNSGIDPSIEVVGRLCLNPQALCRMLLHLMNGGGPQKYYDALLQSPRLTCEVMRDVVLFAIYLDASGKEIVQLLKAKDDLPRDFQCTICSALVKVSYPEVTVRNIFAILSSPNISLQAFQAASSNRWYSKDFIHLLEISMSPV